MAKCMLHAHGFQLPENGILWRSNPIGEVCKDLLFFKEFADKKYIQKLKVPLDRITQHALLEPCKEASTIGGSTIIYVFTGPHQNGRSPSTVATFHKEFEIPLRIPTSPFEPVDRAIKGIE